MLARRISHCPHMQHVGGISAGKEHERPNMWLKMHPPLQFSVILSVCLAYVLFYGRDCVEFSLHTMPMPSSGFRVILIKDR